MSKGYVIVSIIVTLSLIYMSYYVVPASLKVEEKAAQTCEKAGYDRYIFDWGVQIHRINGTEFVECGIGYENNIELVPFNNTGE